MFVCIRVFVIASIFILLPTTGSSAERLDTLIVNASRIEQDVAHLPANVTIITAEQIEKAPANTLSEVLSSQAGINVRSLFGNYSSRATVDLRGFGASSTQNTLILLDGRRLNDIDNAPVDLAAIPLHNIERIEILRGSGSVLYGDGASGGSINIITKRAKEQGVNGLVEVSGGSFDTRKLDAVTSIGLGRLFANLSFNFIDSNGYRDNNSLEQVDAQADIRWRNAETEWFMKLGLDDQSLDLPGGRIVDDSAGINELRDNRTGTSTPDDFAEQDGYLVTVGVQRFVGEDFELILDGGVRHKNQQAFLNFGGGFSSFIDTDLQTWSLTPRLEWHARPFSMDTRIRLGVDAYYSDYESDRSLTESSTPIRRLDVDQTSLAFYGHTVFSPNSSLTATLGGRLQHVDVSARDDFNPAAPGSAFGSQAEDLDRDDTEYLFEAGLQYQLLDSVKMFANVARSTRFATVDELFELDASFAQVFSELEPQVGHVADIGMKYASSLLDLSASLYYGEYRDEIHFDSATFTNINLDDTLRYGIELDVSTRPTRDITLAANYTYTRAEFDGGINSGNDVPLVPRNAASILLSVDVLPAVTVSTMVSYVDSRRFDNDQSNRFGESIPSYIMTDLKVATHWRDWYLNATVSNLTNEKAFDLGVASTFTPGRFSAFPLPERNFILSLGKSF